MKDKRNLVLINGLLAKKTLTARKAQRIAEHLQAEGKSASWARQTGAEYKPAHLSIWGWLNNGGK